MSENTGRMVKTALIGAGLAIVVMVFSIIRDYGLCTAAGVDSYSVQALNMEIYTILKNGSEYVGTPNVGNMIIATMIFMAALAIINEISNKSLETSTNTKKKGKKQSKKNKQKKK